MNKQKLKNIIDVLIHDTPHFRMSYWFKPITACKSNTTMGSDMKPCNTIVCLAGTTQLHFAVTDAEKKLSPSSFFSKYVQLEDTNLEFNLLQDTDLYARQVESDLRNITKREVIDTLVTLANLSGDLEEHLKSFFLYQRPTENFISFAERQQLPKVKKPYNPTYLYDKNNPASAKLG